MSDATLGYIALGLVLAFAAMIVHAIVRHHKTRNRSGYAHTNENRGARKSSKRKRNWMIKKSHRKGGDYKS